MRLPQAFLLLAIPLRTASIAVEDVVNRATTIWSWDLTSPSPQHLAHVSYNAVTLSATVNKYTPPNPPHNPKDPVRVGIYDVEISAWRGVVTSAASFEPQYQQKISLYIDGSANVYHVGFSAYQKAPSKAGGEALDQNREDGQLLVEIVPPNPGPTPYLNKPVVLSPDGKLEGKETEKTFLQK